MLSRSVCLAPSRRAIAAAPCLAAMIFAAACSLVPDQQSLGVDEVERALLPIARVALETGQFETAERLYRRLLDVDPESHSARMGLGDVAFKDRRSEDAAQWYLAAQTSATIPEELYDALLWHGRAALEDGQLTAARRSFERLAATGEEAPTIDTAWALNGIGLTLLLEGDLEGAARYMEQAVRKRPRRADVRRQLGARPRHACRTSRHRGRKSRLGHRRAASLGGGRAAGRRKLGACPPRGSSWGLPLPRNSQRRPSMRKRLLPATSKVRQT